MSSPVPLSRFLLADDGLELTYLLIRDNKQLHEGAVAGSIERRVGSAVKLHFLSGFISLSLAVKGGKVPSACLGARRDRLSGLAPELRKTVGWSEPRRREGGS
jgi:hypothetical protein